MGLGTMEIAIIAAVVGGLLLLGLAFLIAVIAVFFFMRRRGARKKAAPARPPSQEPPPPPAFGSASGKTLDEAPMVPTGVADPLSSQDSDAGSSGSIFDDEELAEHAMTEVFVRRPGQALFDDDEEEEDEDVGAEDKTELFTADMLAKMGMLDDDEDDEPPGRVVAKKD